MYFYRYASRIIIQYNTKCHIDDVLIRELIYIYWTLYIR
jgi:hypothetical protein